MNKRQQIIQYLLHHTQASQRELLQLRCNHVIGMGRQVRLEFPTRECLIGDMDAKREILAWNRTRIADSGYEAPFLGVRKRQLMNDVRVATDGAGIRGYRLT